MNRKDYDKELIKWARNHYWDSLENNKDLILRHLRTFVGDEITKKSDNNSLKATSLPDRESTQGVDGRGAP